MTTRASRSDWNHSRCKHSSRIPSPSRVNSSSAHAQERLERISALHDIDMAITTPLSLQATLDVLLEKVTDRLRVDCAAVALIQPVTHELVYAANHRFDAFFEDGLLKVNEGIAGRVAHTGEVAAIPDVRAEPGFVRAAIADRLGLVSYLAVPLQARGEILGVLELATRQRHEFAPEEIDFFVTLAGQAAIVIDNSRMYEEAVRRAAQLSKALLCHSLYVTGCCFALLPQEVTTLQHSQSPGYTACFASTLPATWRPDPYQDWTFTSKQTLALNVVKG